VRRAVVGVLLSLALCAVTAPAIAGPTTTHPASNTTGLPSAAEGFPWVATGVVALAVGLIGWRLRRAARS